MSDLEDTLLFQMRLMELPMPEREYRFHPKRRWRFDFCWPGLMLAAEVEGAIWASGRHTRGSGYQADAEKYNSAVLLGWRVLRFTDRMIDSGDAIKTILEAMR